MNALIIPAEQFCKHIASAVQSGRAVIPLVGAGLSATAGIPTSDELLLYLKLCIGMALGLDGDLTEVSRKRRWHPHHSVWPQLRSEWVQHAYRVEGRLDNLIHLRLLDDSAGKTKAFQQLCREAWGVMTDWRMALQFLARIKPPIANTQVEEGPGGDFTINPWYQKLDLVPRLIKAIEFSKTAIETDLSLEANVYATIKDDLDEMHSKVTQLYEHTAIKKTMRKNSLPSSIRRLDPCPASS